jgi:exportin-2 (importin alpha re-exporter)
VTSTNTLVHVASFFSEHILQDLQAASGAIHPILQVDSIRFLHTFRNQVCFNRTWPYRCSCLTGLIQLTKEQLLDVMDPLIRHLRSENYVAYTYAAITVERILFIKQDSRLLFVPFHFSLRTFIDASIVQLHASGHPQSCTRALEHCSQQNRIGG